MSYRRVAGLAAALALLARFLITGSAWGDSIVSGGIALCAGVAMTVAFRAGWASVGELSFTWISVVLYASGGVFVDHWSSDGPDIGGGLPYFLGLIGMVVIGFALQISITNRANR